MITPKQLKITNLIFAEHSKLKAEQPLLVKQIEDLEKIANNYSIQDSIRTVEINTYKDEVISSQKKIKRLKTGLNLSSGIGILAILLLVLL